LVKLERSGKRGTLEPAKGKAGDREGTSVKRDVGQRILVRASEDSKRKKGELKKEPPA